MNEFLLGTLVRRSVFQMSQKSITSFFSTRGQKRKLDECETDDTHDDTSLIRSRIITLAKSKSALSPNIGLSWFIAMEKLFSEEFFDELGKKLSLERKKYTVYPPEKDVYSWTNFVKINDVKVVILGQDPYHGPNQAHGLAFSVRKGIRVPRSLENIYKELATDIPGFKAPNHGYLYGWATQGVLLLNAVLTVRAGHPDSHENLGWEKVTNYVISWINQHVPYTVFILWGKKAQKKISLISKEKHLILQAPHPSPFSVNLGFFGCRHFSKTNEYLKSHGKKTIDWNHLP